MLLLLLLPQVLARGPPGMRPPSSFVAESWYPSNLPTVRPPWRQPGVDIKLFQTQEFSDNSVTVPMEDIIQSPKKTTKMAIIFEEDGITEFLSNTTASDGLKRGKEEDILDRTEVEGSGMEAIVEVHTVLTNKEPSSMISTQLELATVTNTTVPTTVSTINIPVTIQSTDVDLQEERDSGSKPFDGEVKEDAKMRGEDCSDLIFVIDSSGNVVSQYEKQKNLVRFILLALGPQKRRLGLVTYSSRRKQRWNINPRHNVTKELYMKKLKKARFLGGVTATGAVLEFLANETIGTNSTIVLLTDGFSFDDVEEAAEKIRELPQMNLYVTGDYFPIVRNVLNSIAGDTEHIFFGRRLVKKLIELLKC